MTVDPLKTIQAERRQALLDRNVPADVLDKPVSGEQMCTLIAAWINATDVNRPQPITPEEIWNASPTGELFHVYTLYDDALIWKYNQEHRT